MRSTLVVILSLVSQLLLLSPVFADESAEKILVTNVHIFNGIDAERLMNANVLIDGKLIEAVSTEAISADDAMVINGKGRTLMPGLIDMHWHSPYASVPTQLGLVSDH